MVFVVAGIVVEVVVEKMAVPEVVPDVRVIVCVEFTEIVWMVTWAATVIVMTLVEMCCCWHRSDMWFGWNIVGLLMKPWLGCWLLDGEPRASLFDVVRCKDS